MANDRNSEERAALLALVRWLGKQPSLLLPLDLHAQVRLALGDDFYTPVGEDEKENPHATLLKMTQAELDAGVEAFTQDGGL